MTFLEKKSFKWTKNSKFFGLRPALIKKHNYIYQILQLKCINFTHVNC